MFRARAAPRPAAPDLPAPTLQRPSEGGGLGALFTRLISHKTATTLDPQTTCNKPARSYLPSTFFLASALTLALTALPTPSLAQDFKLHSFQSRQLTDTYYSEGAAIGDLNRDGHPDLIYGPHWYQGPSFNTKHEIYPPKPQPLNFYADNFFTWIHDFNADGWNDVLVVGLPNTPAFLFENPAGKTDTHWKKHAVFPSVGNESPHFIDLFNNNQPLLLCTHKTGYGFVIPNRDQPFAQWTFHAISDPSMKLRGPHGLGVGDINGDGRNDVLIATGWFEQPASNSQTSTWRFYESPFTDTYGGAEMYAYDVNGDGLNDVITSLAAHDFGLAWYEQQRQGGQITFRKHLIMGDRPSQNPFGLVFSEPHSVALADIDGDGLKDIITGKTYWSHHKQSPMWDAGAVVYWFKLQRSKDGVQWLPFKADGEAGIGRHIRIHDINNDNLPDILVGGMKGAHLLTHTAKTVDEATWRSTQPKLVVPDDKSSRRGPASEIDATTGLAANAIEGESLKVLSASAGKTSIQNMAAFKQARWSDAKQLFWSGGKPGDRLVLEFPISQDGEYDIQAVFTTARDYAIVQVLLDDQPLGEPIDLYDYPQVQTSGLLTLARQRLSKGNKRLAFEIKGANRAALPVHMIGLDYIRLVAPN